MISVQTLPLPILIPPGPIVTFVLSHPPPHHSVVSLALNINAVTLHCWKFVMMSATPQWFLNGFFKPLVNWGPNLKISSSDTFLCSVTNSSFVTVYWELWNSSDLGGFINWLSFISLGGLSSRRSLFTALCAVDYWRAWLNADSLCSLQSTELHPHGTNRLSQVLWVRPLPASSLSDDDREKQKEKHPRAPFGFVRCSRDFLISHLHTHWVQLIQKSQDKAS